MPKAKAKKRSSSKRSSTKRAKRSARPKSVFLRNFTGRVTQNRDKTIAVNGVNNAPSSMRKRAAKKRARR